MEQSPWIGQQSHQPTLPVGPRPGVHRVAPVHDYWKDYSFDWTDQVVSGKFMPASSQAGSGLPFTMFPFRSESPEGCLQRSLGLIL